MNILIPDSWLREYLKTKATPEQIKEYLSLCGPSVERLTKVGSELVYEIEVTSNRPDSMSVVGIAREAAAILPRFGIKAALVNDPYTVTAKRKVSTLNPRGRKLKISVDPLLCPRWTSIVLENITIGSSPTWLQKKLEATGIRPINNVIDITNYLMRSYGQPAHAFDYDKVKGGVMKLRASKKGERIKTLDGKTHTLAGDDIVIEDGSGRLIDLCGIMGAENSSIKRTTKTVVLFMQTYDPVRIRKTSMSLAHRTEAAALFEKGLDSELVLPTFIKGIELMTQLTGGKVSSKLYDLYPKPYKPYTVSANQDKISVYLGTKISNKDLLRLLAPLGLTAHLKKDAITVTVPSFRQDITLDVDIIEEIARLYGYHNISPKLPDAEPPITRMDPLLSWEEEIKIRLRDWGYTELSTYSMISEELMDIFGLDKTKVYKISNPLSNDWVYMRPVLWPSILTAIKQNLNHSNSLRLFELSMVYEFSERDLPFEKPILIVTMNGQRFRELKGVAEALFSLFGISFPEQPSQSSKKKLHNWDDHRRLILGEYGTVSEVNTELLEKLGIHEPVTILDLDIALFVKNAKFAKSYLPIPKYPPIVEDMSFTVSDRFEIGPFITALKNANRLVSNVTLLDVHENSRTVHITYLDPAKNLTNDDVAPIREKLIRIAQEKFAVSVRG